MSGAEVGGTKPSRGDVEALLRDIGDVPHTLDPVTVRRKSRDYFWYSPVLNESLARKFADVVVAPRDEADVIRVAAACARHRVPITPRGGGTGNYGQCVPLHGGVVLDMAGMTRIARTLPGVVSVEPGIRIVDLDERLRPAGWELRMHPSTKRAATIGGFVAGGSGGVGSVTYGGLRDPGNVLRARVVTVEPTPRVIELEADAAQKINRAYGTTGIITELDMPLAPVWNWIEVAVCYDDFMEAVAAAHAVALADGVVKKLVTVSEAPLPSYFPVLNDRCPPGASTLICMIAEPFSRFSATSSGRAEKSFTASPTSRPSRGLRSTNIPGTTSPCTRSSTTAASPICNACFRTTGWSRACARRATGWAPSRRNTSNSSASAGGSPPAACPSSATRPPSG
jgi:hypothetical protein